MSDLHHLLERAAPSPGSSLELDDIRRRVDRRRRRQRVTVLAAIVLVAVAAGVASTLLPDDAGESLDTFTDESTTTATTRPGAPTDDVVLATGVAVSVVDDGVWVVADENDGTFVTQLDPLSAEPIAPVEVDRRVRQLAVAGGTVWAYGPGDAESGNGVVVVLDVASAEVVGTYDPGAGFTPGGLVALDDGTAWVTDAQGDRVVHLRRDAMSEPADEVPVPGQPTDIVLADDGLLWIRSSRNGTIVSVDPVSATVMASRPWDAPLFASAGDGSVWSTDGSRVVQLHPDSLAEGVSVALGARVNIPDSQAVVQIGGGLWIATTSGVSFVPENDLEGPPETLVESPTGVTDLAITTRADIPWLWYVDAAGLHRWERTAPTGG